jgi:predicted kinase
MRYLSKYKDYMITEHSKNDPIPEITQGGKLAIVLLGPPGIGKSTFAKNYITHKNQNMKIFSTDDVSLTMSKDSNVYHKGSSELNLKRLSMFIKSGGSFIYDTTGVQKENISNITQQSRDNGYNVIFVHLMGTLDLSLRQNLERDRNVPSDYIKLAYSEQFKNMKYFSDLNPDSYYVVYNIDGKYKFMKYDGGQLLKRKVDKYVPIKESVGGEFTIEDAYLSAINLSDDGYLLNFYDKDENYLSTDDIDNKTDKFKNFEIYKELHKTRKYEFTIEVTNSNTSLSFEDFVNILNDMSVTIQHLSTKGWTLTDFFASPDDDSVGEFRFYHIRFVFTKPDEKIDNDRSLEKEFTRAHIKSVFDKNGLDSEDITYYDNYIEVEFTNPNYHFGGTDRKLNSIVKQLGATDFMKSTNKVTLAWNF